MTDLMSCQFFAPQAEERNLNGRGGYFRRCTTPGNQSCGPGFERIATCRTAAECRSICGGNAGNGRNCVAGQAQTVCRRIFDDFRPIREGNVIQRCCTITDANQRQRNDCPPNCHPVGTRGVSGQCEDILYQQCLDSDDPDAVVGPHCNRLADSGNSAIVEEYNLAMQTHCMKSLDNLNSEQCIGWCQENRRLCGRERLLELCGTEKGMSPGMARVCGCFYPDKIYDAARKEIAERYNVPANILGGGRKCYFPQCNAASIQIDEPEYQCPSLNLVNCIQTVTIDARNGRIGPISIRQDARCNTFRRNRDPDAEDECSTASDCERGEVCVAGECVAACETNSDCSAGRRCNNQGQCVLRDEDDGGDGGGPLGYSWTTIIILLLLLICCLCLISWCLGSLGGGLWYSSQPTVGGTG